MSEKAFFDLMALQAGAAHVHQAEAEGIPKHRLHQMVKEGSLRRCGIGIVAAAGAPETRPFHLMRAVLIGGYGSKTGTVAAIADITAAIALGMADRPLEPIHVVTTRQIGPKPGLVFHRATRLPPEEVVLTDGVPTTDPIRTFIDVCHSAPPRGPWLFKRGRRMGLFTPESVLERIDTESRQGRGGLVVAREIAASALPGAEKARSGREEEVFNWILEAGLPLPERNVYIPSSFGFDWEVDLLYRHPPIAIEVSPYDTHMELGTYGKDGKKRNDLDRMGYRVIVVTDETTRSEFLALLRHHLGG